MGVRDRLVQLLAERGMNQTELARRLDVGPSWVNKRVRGHLAVEADDVCRLARALGVPVAAFFLDCESPDPMGEVYHAAARVFGLTPEEVKDGGFSMSLEEPPMVAGMARGQPILRASTEEQVRKAVREEVRAALREVGGGRSVLGAEPPA